MKLLLTVLHNALVLFVRSARVPSARDVPSVLCRRYELNPASDAGLTSSAVVARKLLFLAVTVPLVIGFLWLILPMFLFPWGRWPRTVRPHPLERPVMVTAEDLDGLTLADGTRAHLAGVIFTDDAELRTKAIEFLNVVVAQGVESIRQVSATGYLLWCEPRISHWCGNDPVRTHYERFVLNELVLAAGYASLDPQCSGLTTAEASALEARQSQAKSRGLGIWANPIGSEIFHLSGETGLRIEDAYRFMYPGD